jgi:hypothetical protein
VSGPLKRGRDSVPHGVASWTPSSGGTHHWAGDIRLSRLCRRCLLMGGIVWLLFSRGGPLWRGRRARCRSRGWGNNWSWSR